MQKNLVIVESPAKAKTIEKFLGEDYKVMSSFGHIRDLKKKDFGVDLATFQPQYEIPADKVKVVNELQTQAKKPKPFGSHPMKTARRSHFMASGGSAQTRPRQFTPHRFP